MPRLSIKQINSKNWLEVDAILTYFKQRDKNGNEVSVTAEDWIEKILKPQLLDVVPIEVQQLFDVARGTMIYGYFFYPLFALAEGQLYRVTEAAISHKYQMCSGKDPKKKTLEKKIDWLFENNILVDTSDQQRQQGIDNYKSLFPDTVWSEDTEFHVEVYSEKEAWHTLRHIRNDTSHSMEQYISPPTFALKTLCRMAKMINSLFALPKTTE